MINRLVEPAAGRIILNGRDVQRENPAHLRRGIGYVIQETGISRTAPYRRGQHCDGPAAERLAAQ
jgi:ABC-type proline/glycine betaine transport system ATPase subunit